MQSDSPVSGTMRAAAASSAASGSGFMQHSATRRTLTASNPITGPPMANRNQVPHLTPRAKAAKRRSLLASVFLSVVLLSCVGLTAWIWFSRGS